MLLSGIACKPCAVVRMTIATGFFLLVVRSGDYYLFETDSEEEEEEDEKKDDEPPKKSAFQVRKFELWSMGMMLFNASVAGNVFITEHFWISFFFFFLFPRVKNVFIDRVNH